MNTENKLIFLIADDHNIVRQGLEIIIRDLFLGAEIHQVSNLKDLLNVLSRINVHILILDINFTDGSSLNVLEDIFKICPEVKILIFTGFEEDYYALRYIKAGASGFLSKLSSEEEISEALKNIVIKGKHIPFSLKEKILEAYVDNKSLNPLEELSNRELEVARFLVKGYGNLEISVKLQTKQNTISTLKSRIFHKLDINSLSELIDIFNFYNFK